MKSFDSQDSRGVNQIPWRDQVSSYASSNQRKKNDSKQSRNEELKEERDGQTQEREEQNANHTRLDQNLGALTSRGNIGDYGHRFLTATGVHKSWTSCAWGGREEDENPKQMTRVARGEVGWAAPSLFIVYYIIPKLPLTLSLLLERNALPPACDPTPKE